jgi:hypothetical protein
MNHDSDRINDNDQQRRQQEERLADRNSQQYHEDRMTITPAERAWAQEIKTAVAATPDLDPLSDYMYAQMAIVNMAYTPQRNTQSVLDRFRTLQELRQENGVLNTAPHGCHAIQQLVFDLAPGSMLAYNFIPEKKTYVCTMDMTNFDMGILRDPRKTKDWLAACYYLLQAFHPDFESTRKGLIILTECKDYHWKGHQMVHACLFRKWWTELALVYPFHVQKIKYFHTGLFINLLMSTAKKYLPTSILERLEIGCQSEGGRLDQIFMVPDVETANQRLVFRLQDTLKRYYANEASFVL